MEPSDLRDGAAAGAEGADRGGGGRIRPRASRARIALAAGLLAIAGLLAGVRFGFPLIENYRAEVEQWVGGLLQRPVSIDSLQAYWRGWSPELEIRGLKLYRVGTDEAEAGPAVTFDRVRISVDAGESLKSRRLLPHAVTIVGASLTVKRFPDGSIQVAGMQPLEGAASRPMPEDLALWILTEGTLVFDAATVRWVDERRDGPPVLLTGARLELSNSADHHRLRGSFRIPGASEDRIQLALDASGDLRTSDWSGIMAVNARRIRAAELGSVVADADRWLSGGTADLDVSTRWRGGTLQEAQMTIRADGLMLSDALGGLRVHGGSAEVRAMRAADGWSAALELSDLHTSEGRWRSSLGSLRYTVDGPGGRARLVGRFGHARLADVAALMRPKLRKIEFASAAMETYRPSAELNNLHFSFGLGADNVEPFRLTTDFEKLSAFVGPAFPALSGFSGHIEVDAGAGVVTMGGGTVEVALEGVFEQPFAVRTEGGRVAWQRHPDGFRLDVYDVAASAAGAHADVSGSARFDGDPAGPLLNLVASLISDDVAELKRYLPDGILKPKLSEWLRHAVRGGRITDGRVLVHGRPGDFPFDSADGVIEARFAIEDGALQYGRDWPGLSGLSGELGLRGRRLDATLSKGRILDADIEGATIAIDRIGVGVPVVELRGTARGDAEQGFRFLSESPLETRFSEPLRGIRPAGEVGVTLELDFPLDKSGIRVDGRVDIERARVGFPALESGLERLSGTLRFDRRGVRGESLDAVYLGRPVKLEVSTRPQPPHDTRIEISGQADRQFVARHLSNSRLLDPGAPGGAPWLDRIHGETRWLAAIEVPAQNPGSAQKPVMTLESSLEGLGIDLPFPVGKDADDARPFAVSMEAAGGERKLVRAGFGADARAAIELEATDGVQVIRRGTMRLGGGEPGLPDGEGIYVEGALPFLPAGDWVHAWKSAFAPAGAEPPPHNRLKQVALDVERLVMFGSGFDRVRIEAVKNGDGSWNTRFDGPGLEGSVRLLKSADEDTLLATFDRIDYRSAPAENGTRVTNPQDLPAIRLMSERFIFNGRDLGLVRMTATPTAAGLNFSDISAAAPEFEARANGYWHQQDGAHRSEFSISVHSESLGGFLESMGFGASNTSGGATDIFLNARWQASPMEFGLRKLNGSLHFRSGEGRLLGVKRGVTQRIFGLLSVTTLPQRLILDFTDLFEKGVGYESIEGSFNLENGEAYTNNLTMETDTARIEIAGRTGLVTEDYDQVMTVTPKLTSSLPLAPLWLAEKAFNREIFGKTFAAQYTITGSWTDPKVEPVQVESEPAEKG